MESSGLIEIQSHSASHVPMAEQSFDQLVLQMRKSKYLVEKNMGHPCDMFAYPYGSYNDATIEAARRAGYHMQLLVGDATTDLDFEVNLPSEGRESITRITIAGTMGNVNVIETIRTAMAKKVVPADWGGQ